MPDALFLRNVSKRYSGHVAVDNLDISIPRGTIYGILGPNGAGKSSTIRTALNIISRDSGEVRILNEDPIDNPAVLRRVGYLPEERGLYPKMRILDVVVFFGRLKGMPARLARSEGDAWLERMGLSDWKRSRVETLSKGMQQKVQFIITVIHQPELVFLDEPTGGLDPVNQDVLKETMRGLRDQGKTVVFSTHNMTEAEQLCDSVCIISRGRKILDGPLDEIRRVNRGNRWRIQYDDPPEAARELFGRPGQFADVVPLSRGWEVTLDSDASVRNLLTALTTFEQVPSRVERIHPTLHEIFVQHVGGVAATAARKGRADA